MVPWIQTRYVGDGTLRRGVRLGGRTSERVRTLALEFLHADRELL